MLSEVLSPCKLVGARPAKVFGMIDVWLSVDIFDDLFSLGESWVLFLGMLHYDF